MTEFPLVHVVRHGKVNNPEEMVYGRLDGFPLLPEGVEQAQEAGEFLKTVVQNPKTTLVGWSRLFGLRTQHARKP